MDKLRPTTTFCVARKGFKQLIKKIIICVLSSSELWGIAFSGHWFLGTEIKKTETDSKLRLFFRRSLYFGLENPDIRNRFKVKTFFLMPPANNFKYPNAIHELKSLPNPDLAHIG